MDGLGTGGAGGWVLHRFESLGEGGVAEVGVALMAVYAIKKGRNFKELETGVHEVEVLDVLLRGHDGSLRLNWRSRNAGGVLEEIGAEIGEGFAEFGDLFGGAVDFDADELGEGEGFFDAGADVFEVGEEAFGSGVGFAAEDDVSADGEIVVVAGFFVGGASDETGHEFLEGIEFSFVDLEVGIDADGLREFGHLGTLLGFNELSRGKLVIFCGGDFLMPGGGVSC